MLTSEDVDDAFDDEAFMEERFSDVQRLLLDRAPVPGPDTLVLLPATRCRLTVGPHASGPFGRCFAVRLEPRPDLSAACVELLLADDGSLLGLVDAGALDGWRGAIPSGLAARYLAPPAPSRLGLFGTGEAAWACLLVLHHALPSLTEVRVVGREPDRARDFAAAAALRTGLRVRVSEDARATAASADVVAVTGGHPPVRAAWLAAGALLIDQAATVSTAEPGDPRDPVTGPRPADTGPETDTEPDTDAGPEPDTGPETDTEPDTDAGPEPDAEPGTGRGARPFAIGPGVWLSGGGSGSGPSHAGQGAQPSGTGPAAPQSGTGQRAESSGTGQRAESSGTGPVAPQSGTGQSAQPSGTGPATPQPGTGSAAPSFDAATAAPGPVVRHVSIAPSGGRSVGTRQQSMPIPLAEIVAGRALPRRSGSDIVHYRGGELAGWSVIAAVAGLGHAWRRDVGIPVRLGRGGS
ncbi:MULTISPECIES: hypothetical protein [Streptomyces]|uniref:hypothetical protein n=1 Tax=Streptomyces TaxID=1883 RepID=UPI002034C3EB|nr:MULTISPECIES: hypothetical protein [Streptomyces]UUA06978.1 hypothetical protein NNW98_16165 [Streptomyces koelreuteriae]UUA14607.1 hypothetical protein NNW99_16160 [Streptomyces sp. CRCS-T-1]